MLRDIIKGLLVINNKSYKDLNGLGSPAAISQKLQNSNPTVNVLISILKQIDLSLAIIDQNGKILFSLTEKDVPTTAISAARKKAGAKNRLKRSDL
ncbi:hypothetical protein [Dialister sp.]|jgi:hypothetical protein|uniref:hypothetical protein n=1 Tax=Dialister sp. TaxID=1955814 RepID=UPI002E8125DB|nr:hypothetical protein [Dialister sp.]MEE3453283.1 hypothetical protein [Dialister sp.]